MTGEENPMTINSHWTYQGLEDAYHKAKNLNYIKDPWGTRLIRWGYKHMGKPFIFRMEPDKAHSFTVNTCNKLSRITPFMALLHDVTNNADVSLNKTVMGLHYKNPYGLAAGLDKDAQIITILDAAGFGFTSYGSMTIRPCDGNPRPWFHRYPDYKSMGIHAGIPNQGAETVLAAADAAPSPYGVIRHASVAFTNTSYPDGADGMIHDFTEGVKAVMGSKADVCEINISCPNLQAGKPFKDPKMVEALFQSIEENVQHLKPILVKMPNATVDVIDSIIEVLAGHDVQGLALCNLQEDKSEWPEASGELGGLSGVPCNKNAVEAVRFVRGKYGNRFAIEGVGGVMDRDDAMRMQDAGADLVGFVSTLMFNGPQMASEFKTAYRGALQALDDETWSSTSVDA